MKEQDMIKVNNKDSKQLTDTIVEVEACQELYNEAIADADFPQQIFKGILEKYMKALRIHKEKWRWVQEKYIEEEDLLYYRDAYRFDVYKKVIFLPENVGE